MLAFLFTSYELFVVSRLMPQVAADNPVIIHLSAQKERCLSVHAKPVYYVYIGKSRDFNRIYCNNPNGSSFGLPGQSLFHYHTERPVPRKSRSGKLIFLHFSNYSYSSNSGVEKYLSAVSGSTVTTVFPSPSFLASFSAAATFVPDEIPHIIPSLAARPREV